jgi:hypothetical protein
MVLGAGFGALVILATGAVPLILIAAPVGAAIGSLFGLAVGIPLAGFVALATHRLRRKSVVLGMHIVTFLATLLLAATYIRRVPISARAVLEFGLFFVIFGQLGVAIVARWYRRQWPDRTPHPAGIATTARGAWANGVVYGTALGALGAAMVSATLARPAPELLLVYAAVATLVGATFGFIVGNAVGILFAVLVVVADERNGQANLARAMPWLAVAISEPIALLLGLQSLKSALMFAALDAVFAFIGGRSIARRYLRAEGPKIRQLVH